MKREGDTLIFEAGEDIVCGDLRLSNKGGYQVELDLSDDGNAEFISVFSDKGSLCVSLDFWFELGLSLDDVDVFSSYRDNKSSMGWRTASLDVWNYVEE